MSKLKTALTVAAAIAAASQVAGAYADLLPADATPYVLGGAAVAGIAGKSAGDIAKAWKDAFKKNRARKRRTR